MAPKPVDVEFRGRGIDGLSRSIQFLKGDLHAFGEKGKEATAAGQSLAGVFLQIAHHGDLSGRELKELVREGGELITLMGPNGLLLGGVTLLGVAFYEAFARGQEEMRKTRELLQGIDDDIVKLRERSQGNLLGVKELEIAENYRKKLEEIKKLQPGFFSNVMALGGLNFWDNPQLPIALQQARKDLEKGTYGKGGEHDEAVRLEALRQGLASSAALQVGLDPVQRYKEQLRQIELERKKAIDTGELSEKDANARAAAQKQLLDRQGYDLDQRLGTEVMTRLATYSKTVFDAREKAEEGRYQAELAGLDKLTLSEEMRRKEVERIKAIHGLISAEIQKQKDETIALGHAQAQQGSLNPVEQIKGQLAAIELRKKKAIEAGTAEVDAARIAEAEKRQIFTSSIEAAVGSNQSLAKIATQFAVDPLIKYLEGLANKEQIEAISQLAYGNVAGFAMHEGASLAAVAGAHEIAGLVGGIGGGGGHAGSGGGLSAGSVGLATAGGGTTTIIVQGGQVGWNLDNPDDLEAFNEFLEKVAHNRLGGTNIRIVRS